MLRIHRSRLAIGLAAALLGGAPCWAQAIPGLVAPSPGAAADRTLAQLPVEEVLEISDIHSRALVLQGRLRAIRSDARPRIPVVRIEEELKELRATLDRDRATPAIAVGPESTAAQLEFLEQIWRERLLTTRGWDALLLRRGQELQKLAVELRAAKVLWARTRVAKRDEVLSSVQIDRIAATLAAIAETESVVVARRDHVWRLADQNLEVQLTAREELDQIEEIRTQQWHGLAATRAAPLWRALADGFREGGFFRDARAALVGHASKIRMAVDLYSSRLRWHALILIGLAAAFAWIRRRSRGWDQDDPALTATVRIFGHPIASATVIAMLLSWILYPLAPSSLFALIGLLALIPTLVILPDLLPLGLRKYSYILGGLYFATQLITMSGPDAVFDRILVLTISIAAADVLGRLSFLAQSGRFEALRGGWARAVSVASVLGTFMLLVAIVANVIGKSQLGAFLTVATVRSAFIAVFLFVGALVSSGLWVVLLRSPAAKQLRVVQFHGELLRQKGLRYIRVGLVVLWLTATLRQLELGEPLWAGLTWALSASLELRKLRLSLGMVVSFFGVLWAARLLSRFVRFFLDEDILPRLPLERGVPRAISLSLHYVLMIGGFLAALAAAGVQLSQFTILGGAFGIGLAFGMQNIVNNFVSGLILLYERPIHVGDSIEMGTTAGDVERIGIRSSTVRTWDGAEIIVPNADLIAKEVTNWTLSDRRRRIQIRVGVAYGSDPTRILHLLEELASRNQEILQSPPPSALFIGFGESALNFVLRVWTDRYEEGLRIQSDLHVAVDRALVEAGIEIPFPQREVHLRSVDPVPAGGASGPDGRS